MKKLLLLNLLFFLPYLCSGQISTCACCSDAHSEFDFWLGDWEVYDESGLKLGENQIIKIENNCILSENWRSESGGTGKSYNYYDPADQTWNQLWLSSDGTILKLKGSYLENSMVLISEPVNTSEGSYFNQISWRLNTDGSVTQLWEAYNLEGNLIKTVFHGIYRPKK